MAKNEALSKAKNAKKDELYTQYEDNALGRLPDQMQERVVIVPAFHMIFANFSGNQ